MIRGALFTRYFLDDGIRQMEQYRRLPDAQIAGFAEAVRERWGHLEQMARPSEAETESEFIFPVLELLAWEHLPQQEPGRPSRHCRRAFVYQP